MQAGSCVHLHEHLQLTSPHHQPLCLQVTFGICGDYLGRKKIYLVTLILMIACTIGQCFAATPFKGIGYAHTHPNRPHLRVYSLGLFSHAPLILFPQSQAMTGCDPPLSLPDQLFRTVMATQPVLCAHLCVLGSPGLATLRTYMPPLHFSIITHHAAAMPAESLASCASGASSSDLALAVTTPYQPPLPPSMPPPAGVEPLLALCSPCRYKSIQDFDLKSAAVFTSSSDTSMPSASPYRRTMLIERQFLRQRAILLQDQLQ